MRRTVRSTVVGAALTAIGAAVPVAAQDVKIVNVQVKDEVIREVHRQVTRAVDQATRDEVIRHVERAVRDGSPRFVVIDQRGNRYPAKAEHRETKTLAIGSTGSLDLRNLGGNISITAGAGKDAVIEIVRQARGRTDADAKRGLEEVTVEVDHRGDRAILSVNDPRQRDRDNYSVSVGYTATVPPGTRVNVSSLGATVNVNGVKGDVLIDVAGGDITITSSRVSRAKSMGGDITLTDVDNEATMEVGTFGGDIVIERARMKRLSAETMGGELRARDISADEASLSSLAGDVEYSGSLSKNGRYELRTHSGDVRFVPGGTVGFEIEATTFSGRVQPAVDLALKILSKTQRGFRGIAGDGSARVIVSALSGDVIILRK